MSSVIYIASATCAHCFLHLYSRYSLTRGRKVNEESVALGEAIQAAGGPCLMAQALSDRAGRNGASPVSRFMVYRWTKTGRVPTKWLADIEEISGVSRQRLRPEAYR